MVDDCRGIICPKCNQEVFRIIDGICIRCHRAKEAKQAGDLEDKSMKNYYKDKLRRGTIRLREMREGSLEDGR